MYTDGLQLNLFVDLLGEENKIQAVGLGLESLAQLQRGMLETLDFANTETETLSRYGMGLIIEVAEFLNETPWKSWPKDPTKKPDLERITEEFVDMLSYLGSWVNFLNMLGVNSDTIADAYRKKLAENNRRFGVSNVAD